MHPPQRYGLYWPCCARQCWPDGTITLELAAGQLITARLEGLKWPEDHDAAVRLQSYVGRLIFAADHLTCYLYSPTRGDHQIHYVEHRERELNRSIWPARLYVEGQDLVAYLHETAAGLAA